MRSLAALAALLAAASAWGPATACSLSEEYMRPTDFELVQISDSIVVATAREERPGAYGPVVAFDVGERVKGEAPGRVEVAGSLEAPGPGELSGAGPRTIVALDSCGRGPFRKNGRYLLFLQKDEAGKLGGLRHRLSRISEEYAGEDSDWVRIVRRYVRLQATAAPMAQISIMERLAESGRGLAGEPLNAAEIRDIRDHLRSISPYKPTAYLLAAYAALERGRMPPYGVRPRGRDPAAMRRRVLTALVTGDHPGAMPLFERLAAETPEDPDRMGLVLRFFARNGAYARAFRWVETRLMKRLPQLDPPAAKRLIDHVARMQAGEGEGEEPWRSDPRAAALWPELALSLYWYQIRAFGSDDAIGLGDAIRTLPRDDYRARPLLTLALAADHEAGIHEWALLELGDEKKRKAWEKLPEAARQDGGDPAALPLRVLLSAWEKKHEKVLEQVFCQDEARRLLLLRAIGDSGDFLYADLIMNVAASPLTGKERSQLREAVAQWARRNEEMLRSSIHSGLEADLRRGRAGGRPIDCGNGR